MKLLIVNVCKTLSSANAREVEKLFPEVVMTDAKGYKSVDYGRLTPVLVEAMKEQQKQIDHKQRQIEDQQKQINELRILLEKLLTVNK